MIRIASNDNNSGKSFFKKQGLNLLILIALIGLTFFIIFKSNSSFSFSDFVTFLEGLNKFYLTLAFAFMLLFIIFEALSLKVILNKLGHKPTLVQSLVYSTSDIYYSSITPSATGGQPASAYYMVKDGVPVSSSTAALTFNVAMYVASIMIIAFGVLVIRPSLFLNFSPITKILVILGVVVQFAIFMLFILLMVKPDVLHFLAKKIVSFGAKIHLVKHKEKKLKKLESSMENYANCIKQFFENKLLTIKVLLLNLAQRLSQIAISLCIYYAVGVNGASAVDILALQAYCLVASNCIPLPGAVGASEALYLDAFGSVFSSSMLLNCMMATRGISYYISFILCGIITMIYHIKLIFKKK